MRVHAHSPIHADGKAGGALAAEGALRVDAAAVHANAGRLTLVNVWGGDSERSACGSPSPCKTFGCGKGHELISIY